VCFDGDEFFLHPNHLEDLGGVRCPERYHPWLLTVLVMTRAYKTICSNSSPRSFKLHSDTGADPRR
jgi:hypothetical protein